MEEEEYFQSIEAYFLQKRGNPHLLSPKEWSLILEWYDANIPQEIVLRAIDLGFEKKKDNSPSLNYFKRIVARENKRYLKSLEGAAPGETAPDPGTKNVQQFLENLVLLLVGSIELAVKAGNRALADLLIRSKEKLEAEILKGFQEAQPVDLQRVEHQLTTLEKDIEQMLMRTIPDQQLLDWKEDAMRELKTFEHKVDLPVYQEMINRGVIKAIRKQYNVPRLSLFYM